MCCFKKNCATGVSIGCGLIEGMPELGQVLIQKLDEQKTSISCLGRILGLFLLKVLNILLLAIIREGIIL